MVSFAGLDILGPENKAKGRWLMLGLPGTGKTYGASTIAGLGKTLFIDTPSEEGTESFEGAPWAANIDIVRPTTVQQVTQILAALRAGGHGYQAVVVDSMTGLFKMIKRQTFGKAEDDFAPLEKNVSIQQYKHIVEKLDEFILWFYALATHPTNPVHVVITAQPKTLDDDVAGSQIIVPDVQNGAVPTLRSTPAYIVYTVVEDGQHQFYFGSNPRYSVKSRVKPELWGKIPATLEGSNANLTTLSRVLGLAPASATK